MRFGQWRWVHFGELTSWLVVLVIATRETVDVRVLGPWTHELGAWPCPPLLLHNAGDELDGARGSSRTLLQPTTGQTGMPWLDHHGPLRFLRIQPTGPLAEITTRPFADSWALLRGAPTTTWFLSIDFNPERRIVGLADKSAADMCPNC